MRRIPGPLLMIVAVFLVVGGVLNETGPFAPHPEVAYQRFIDDVAAGRVQRVVQWRDRLEVTIGSVVVAVRIPPEVDAWADIGAAAAISQRGWSHSVLPDNWVFPFTPIFPALLLAAAAVLVSMTFFRGGDRPVATRKSS